LAATKEQARAKEMRIVAGKAKGRTLIAPKGLDVRPTTDRVREALFSSIGQRVVGAEVLDLFAGSGALGLEALSRGATSAIFVERSKKAIKYLTQNIDHCGFKPSSRLMARDSMAALGQLERESRCFDVVFLDPPYTGPLLNLALAVLAASTLISEETLIVAEHVADSPPFMPKGLMIASQKRYGKTILSFVQQETST
jgi:16S rRNA (guanine(966)-N(2))-methyltransferase RsmD